MKSQLALSEIHRLEAQGVRLSAEEVIRLNAFGLAVDIARGKRPVDDIFRLPRVAWLRNGVYFQQPTIGHEIWIDDVLRFVDRSDAETVLAVNCYALSRPAAELPPSTDPANVQRAVDAYCATMRDFIRAQLYAAIDYVTYGFDEYHGETAAHVERPDEPDDEPDEATADWDSCIALGMLHRGAAVLLGLSLADLRSMTREQLRTNIRTAAINYNLDIDPGITSAEANFYAVLNEITAAHENERTKKLELENGVGERKPPLSHSNSTLQPLPPTPTPNP